MKKDGIKVLIVIFLVFSVGVFFIGLFSNLRGEVSSGTFSISGNVVDYGTFDDSVNIDFYNKMESKFLENIGNGKRTYFIYGDDKEIKISTFDSLDKGNINLLVGENTQTFKLKENKYTLRKITPENNNVEVIIGEKNYNFNIKAGESIYLVVSDKL